MLRVMLMLVVLCSGFQAQAGPESVAIRQFAYAPADITVAKGTVVRWENFDSIEHTVTSQTGPGTLIPSGVFESGKLGLGDVFEFRFEEVGVFHYFCLPHGSSMQGVVRVTPGAPARYTDTILVANDASYEPLIMVDPLLQNGWGIAIRPPGAGGHFWISNFNTGTTTTYVGDVHNGKGKFTPLFQDELTVVAIPRGAGLRFDGTPTAPVPQMTGQVYNYSTTDFVVSGEGITNAAKFIFVTGEGTISAWTERTGADGVHRRQTTAVLMVDQSQEYDDDRLRFTGCAVTDLPANNRLYVTNFTTDEVEVYDHTFQRVPLPAGRFRYPDQPEGFRAWNIQHFRTGPGNAGRLWVAYAMMEEPWEEDPAFGAVAEFDLEGNFIRRLATSIDSDRYADSELRAPWGLAIAPANFGPLSNTMLVANFGDGTIAGFDLATGRFVDFLRDNNGTPLVVDGVWGLTFGNGVGLGDLDALYYAAGPNNEIDGTFGTIRLTSSTCPVIALQPAHARVCAQEDAVFSVEAPSPVRVRFQWQSKRPGGTWSDLADGSTQVGSVIAGAQERTLRIAGVRPGDVGVYRCIASNACGSATSDPAVLSFCLADFDCDATVTPSDLVTFLKAFQGNQQSADLNHDEFVNTQDLFEFVLAFFVGC